MKILFQFNLKEERKKVDKYLRKKNYFFSQIRKAQFNHKIVLKQAKNEHNLAV